MESASVKAARLDFSKLDQPVYVAGWRMGLVVFGASFAWILLFRAVWALGFGTEWSFVEIGLQAAFLSFFVWGLQRLASSSLGLPGLARIRQSATVPMFVGDIDAALERLRTHVQTRYSLQKLDGCGNEVIFQYRGMRVPIHAFACDQGVRVESRPKTNRFGGDCLSLDEGRTLREVQWAVSILEESVESDRTKKPA